jgi:predicted RNA-binding protein with TRAM domain
MVFMAKSSGGQNPPVKEGQVHNGTVVGFGKTGDPIIKIEKYTIFLKDCNPMPELNAVVPVKIVKVLPSFGFAEVLPDE